MEAAGANLRSSQLAGLSWGPQHKSRVDVAGLQPAVDQDRDAVLMEGFAPAVIEMHEHLADRAASVSEMARVCMTTARTGCLAGRWEPAVAGC
jgi:hypothetical protein